MNRCRYCGKETAIAQLISGYGKVCNGCRKELGYAAVLLTADDTAELIPYVEPVMSEEKMEEILGAVRVEALKASETVFGADTGAVLMIDELGKVTEPRKQYNMAATVLYGKRDPVSRVMKDYVAGDALLMTRHEMEGIPAYGTHLYPIAVAEKIYDLVEDQYLTRIREIKEEKSE